MFSERNRVLISVALKFVIFILSTVGILLNFLGAGFMGGASLPLYFTIQSNIWIGITDLVLAVMMLSSLRGGNLMLPKYAYIIQLMFTVAITLTGVVYCFVLLPVFMMQAGEIFFNPLSIEQILVHVLVPILAVVDFVGFTRHANFKMRDSLWAVIPPLYYLIFSLVGYFENWDFGGGLNYPYFFLNYASPAGVFGTSDVMPYFMGSGFWILAILIFVLLISSLYIFIINRMVRKMSKGI